MFLLIVLGLVFVRCLFTQCSCDVLVSCGLGGYVVAFCLVLGIGVCFMYVL